MSQKDMYLTPRLLELFNRVKSDHEYFASKTKDAEKQMQYQVSRKILETPPSEYKLLYYEEQKSDEGFSEKYDELIDTRVGDDDDVDVLYEYYDDTVFYAHKTSTLVVCMDIGKGGETQFVVGVFERDTPIT